MLDKKNIKSKDGKIEVQYDEVTHVCICVVIYALLQYLLLEDDNVVKHNTVYFCYDKGISEDVRNRLPSISFTNPKGGRLKRVFFKLLKKWEYGLRYPFIKRAKIYAQDHMPLAAILIGKNKYSLLSDGPNCFTVNYLPNSVFFQARQSKKRSLTAVFEKIILGDLCVNNMGGNPQCEMIFLTEPNKSPLLDNRHVDTKSLSELWNDASVEKKQFILDVFGLHDEDIALLNSKSICFLSQPFVDDSVLSVDEYKDLLEQIFQKYDNSQIIIKTHPRDTFDYKKYFPQIALFDKPIGTQLLAILGGVNMKKVVTVCSSAIDAFPHFVEAEVYGTRIHPKILAALGETYTFSRSFIKVSL